MFKLNDGVVSLEIDGEYIIIDCNTGRYLAANRTAYDMITAASINSQEEETIAELSTLYDVNRGVLRQDYAELQDQLITLGLAKS